MPVDFCIPPSYFTNDVGAKYVIKTLVNEKMQVTVMLTEFVTTTMW
jgi:hypothetical protein